MSVTQRGVHRWGLVGLLLLAWALRLPPLLGGPLHPDEALYGYWGLLISQGQDPWLASLPVDKPPLLPYLIAILQSLFGSTVAALRLPGLMAGMLAIPLVGLLAQALYRDPWVSRIATIAVALSPSTVLLSGTAFLDPLMVTLGLGACVTSARGSEWWAGGLAGLSFATKQTGLAWLPLVLGIAHTDRSTSARFMRGFIPAFLAPVTAAVVWDSVRMAMGAGSVWCASLVNYGGLRLIWSHELWPRLRAWWSVMKSLFGSPLVNLLLLAGLPLLFWRGIARRLDRHSAYLDLLLVSFCLVTMLLHWLVAFLIRDRYLLILVPVLAVLLGRVTREAALLWNRVTHRRRDAGRKRHRRVEVQGVLCALLVIALLVGPARAASAGRSALIEERASFRGIEEVVSFYRQLPEGAVVYHHWLGWHYRYALFDDPVYLAYWPTPAWLAQDVQAFGRREPRYITFPAWESVARVERALGDVGYGLHPALIVTPDGDDPSFVVYHIVRLPAP